MENLDAFRELDFMGAELLLSRNIAKLVECGVTKSRLSNFKKYEYETFKEMFGE